ncbi:hypothetical protein DD509_08195 [Dehalogenimonas alkenigignens]|uniref:YdhG-like domain-containing protein n=1 Tax=Dehalogenimonas alkenigignens TaxID=1217799 RepID=A0A0W0GK65_9CHLR|nr:hypothetical protein DEALK_17610 [Dehalogenimonas alkenigignens]PVV82758.1 hypothetical protein DD509_08195 [Dehalogenimonas alkenigignens]
MIERSPATIDEFVRGFPAATQEILKKLRRLIGKLAPEATEAIVYGIPTFRLNGNLVHFSALKNHIGFYPTPSAIEAFKEELKAYATSKGAVQFPLDQPIPYDLIERMVQFRVSEQRKKAV